MKRTASEIIRSLEMRVARLEKQAMITREVYSLHSLKPEKFIDSYVDTPSNIPDWFQIASNFGLEVDEVIKMPRSPRDKSFDFKATDGRPYRLTAEYA